MGCDVFPPGNFPDPGIKPSSLTSPALSGRFFTTNATWEGRVFSLPYAFLGGTSGKQPLANSGDVRDPGLIPGSGRSPEERNGNPLQ